MKLQHTPNKVAAVVALSILFGSCIVNGNPGDEWSAFLSHRTKTQPIVRGFNAPLERTHNSNVKKTEDTTQQIHTNSDTVKKKTSSSDPFVREATAEALDWNVGRHFIDAVLKGKLSDNAKSDGENSLLQKGTDISLASGTVFNADEQLLLTSFTNDEFAKKQASLLMDSRLNPITDCKFSDTSEKIQDRNSARARAFLTHQTASHLQNCLQATTKSAPSQKAAWGFTSNMPSSNSDSCISSVESPFVMHQTMKWDPNGSPIAVLGASAGHFATQLAQQFPSYTIISVVWADNLQKASQVDYIGPNAWQTLNTNMKPQSQSYWSAPRLHGTLSAALNVANNPIVEAYPTNSFFDALHAYQLGIGTTVILDLIPLVIDRLPHEFEALIASILSLGRYVVLPTDLPNIRYFSYWKDIQELVHNAASRADLVASMKPLAQSNKSPYSASPYSSWYGASYMGGGGFRRSSVPEDSPPASQPLARTGSGQGDQAGFVLVSVQTKVEQQREYDLYTTLVSKFGDLAKVDKTTQVDQNQESSKSTNPTDQSLSLTSPYHNSFTSSRSASASSGSISATDPHVTEDSLPEDNTRCGLTYLCNKRMCLSPGFPVQRSSTKISTWMHVIDAFTRLNKVLEQKEKFQFVGGCSQKGDALINFDLMRWCDLSVMQTTRHASVLCLALDSSSTLNDKQMYAKYASTAFKNLVHDQFGVNVLSLVELGLTKTSTLRAFNQIASLDTSKIPLSTLYIKSLGGTPLMWFANALVPIVSIQTLPTVTQSDASVKRNHDAAAKSNSEANYLDSSKLMGKHHDDGNDPWSKHSKLSYESSESSLSIKPATHSDDDMTNNNPSRYLDDDMTNNNPSTYSDDNKAGNIASHSNIHTQGSSNKNYKPSTKYASQQSSLSSTNKNSIGSDTTHTSNMMSDTFSRSERSDPNTELTNYKASSTLQHPDTLLDSSTQSDLQSPDLTNSDSSTQTGMESSSDSTTKSGNNPLPPITEPLTPDPEKKVVDKTDKSAASTNSNADKEIVDHTSKMSSSLRGAHNHLGKSLSTEEMKLSKKNSDISTGTTVEKSSIDQSSRDNADTTKTTSTDTTRKTSTIDTDDTSQSTSETGATKDSSNGSTKEKSNDQLSSNHETKVNSKETVLRKNLRANNNGESSDVGTSTQTTMNQKASNAGGRRLLGLLAPEDEQERESWAMEAFTRTRQDTSSHPRDTKLPPVGNRKHDGSRSSSLDEIIAGLALTKAYKEDSSNRSPIVPDEYVAAYLWNKKANEDSTASLWQHGKRETTWKSSRTSVGTTNVGSFEDTIQTKLWRIVSRSMERLCQHIPDGQFTVFVRGDFMSTIAAKISRTYRTNALVISSIDDPNERKQSEDLHDLMRFPNHLVTRASLNMDTVNALLAIPDPFTYQLYGSSVIQDLLFSERDFDTFELRLGAQLALSKKTLLMLPDWSRTIESFVMMLTFLPSATLPNQQNERRVLGIIETVLNEKLVEDGVIRSVSLGSSFADTAESSMNRPSKTSESPFDEDNDDQNEMISKQETQSNRMEKFGQLLRTNKNFKDRFLAILRTISTRYNVPLDELIDISCLEDDSDETCLLQLSASEQRRVWKTVLSRALQTVGFDSTIPIKITTMTQKNTKEYNHFSQHLHAAYIQFDLTMSQSNHVPNMIPAAFAYPILSKTCHKIFSSSCIQSAATMNVLHEARRGVSLYTLVTLNIVPSMRSELFSVYLSLPLPSIIRAAKTMGFEYNSKSFHTYKHTEWNSGLSNQETSLHLAPWNMRLFFHPTLGIQLKTPLCSAEIANAFQHTWDTFSNEIYMIHYQTEPQSSLNNRLIRSAQRQQYIRQLSSLQDHTVWFASEKGGSVDQHHQSASDRWNAIHGELYATDTFAGRASGRFSALDAFSGAGELGLPLSVAYPEATVISVDGSHTLTDLHLAAVIRNNLTNAAVCRRDANGELFQKLLASPEFFRFVFISRPMEELLHQLGEDGLAQAYSHALGMGASSFFRVPDATLLSLAFTTLFLSAPTFSSSNDASANALNEHIWIMRNHPRPRLYGAEVRLMTHFSRPLTTGDVSYTAWPVLADVDGDGVGGSLLAKRRYASLIEKQAQIDLDNLEKYSMKDLKDDETLHKKEQSTQDLSWFLPPNLGLGTGWMRFDIKNVTRNVNHHFESEIDGHKRKYTLHVQQNTTASLLLFDYVRHGKPSSKTQQFLNILSSPTFRQLDSFSRAVLYQRLHHTDSIITEDPNKLYQYLAAGNHPNNGEVVSVRLSRNVDNAFIPYTTVNGVTLITVLRLGLLAPLRARAYYQFVRVPLYQDMAPWNIVLTGSKLDYIDFDTRDHTYDKLIPHIYELMEVLFNYKRTLDDLGRCESKAPNPYNFPFVSDCVGSSFTGPCKDTKRPVPCGDGKCHSDYISCLRSRAASEGKDSFAHDLLDLRLRLSERATATAGSDTVENGKLLQLLYEDMEHTTSKLSNTADDYQSFNHVSQFSIKQTSNQQQKNTEQLLKLLPS